MDAKLLFQEIENSPIYYLQNQSNETTTFRFFKDEVKLPLYIAPFHQFTIELYFNEHYSCDHVQLSALVEDKPLNEIYTWESQLKLCDDRMIGGKMQGGIFWLDKFFIPENVTVVGDPLPTKYELLRHV